MRSRLLGSTMLIALASVLVLGVPLAVVGGQLVREDARGRLEREADAVDAVVERDLVAHRALDQARIAALVEPGTVSRSRFPTAGGWGSARNSVPMPWPSDPEPMDARPAAAGAGRRWSRWPRVRRPAIGCATCG